MYKKIIRNDNHRVYVVLYVEKLYLFITIYPLCITIWSVAFNTTIMAFRSILIKIFNNVSSYAVVALIFVINSFGRIITSRANNKFPIFIGSAIAIPVPSGFILTDSFKQINQ